MATTVYKRDGMGGTGTTYTVYTGLTVRLGRFVERTGDGTVREAQVNSEAVVGVAFATQARSIFQSDGATARADNTVYAGEALAVGHYGVYKMPTGGSSTLVAGDPVQSGAEGVATEWTPATNNRCCGKAVSDPYTESSVEYVDVAVLI